MLFKLTNLVFSAACCLRLAAAVNLRNGPKDLSVDLHGLIGSNDLEHGRKLAMKGHAVRDLADFDWDIQPEPGYPSISFEGSGEESEVRFLYNYTGTTVPGAKYIKHQLLRGDCVTPASPDAVTVSYWEDITAAKEYQVDVDILQESVAGTPEYMDIDVTAAMINFCIRVDYIYKDGDEPEEGIMFHETNVTINIDLTANFTLTAISVDRIDADQVDEDVALNCEVQAYFCDQDNVDVGQPTFVQGEIMTVCVEIADSDRDLYHLNDVMDMELQQIKGDRISVDRSTIVADQRATGLSDKFCQNGICNIRHQLSSKFFDERDPNNLDISGIAICAFGPLSTFTRRVNRQFTPEFSVSNNSLRGEETSVEACKTQCLGLEGCQAFSAQPLTDSLYECVYFTVYPRDEDLADSNSVVVYTRNSVVAPV